MVILVGFCATMIIGGLLTLDGVLAVGTYSVRLPRAAAALALTRLGATFDLYQRAMASTERVLDLLDTPVEITDGEHAFADVEGCSLSRT